MLKRNSVSVLLIILTIVLTGNLFGQGKAGKRKIPPPVNSTKSPRNSEQRSNGWSLGASNPTSMGNSGMVKQQNSTPTSGQSTGKRQYKPLRIGSTQPVNGTTQQIGGDVHPGQDGMGGTGMVKQQSQTNTSKSARKPKNFRPNPAGDGTTQQLYGDVHPSKGDMGTGMIKGQSTVTANSNNQNGQKGKSLKSKGNKPKPAGFMDYTDDAAMTQKSAEKENGYIGETEKNLKTNQKQNPSYRPNPSGDGTTQQARPKRGGKNRVQTQSENENKLGNFEIQSAKPEKPAATKARRQHKP